LIYKLIISCFSCRASIGLSSRIIKVSHRRGKQYDLQYRVPISAQIAGIKRQQFTDFLNLMGIGGMFPKCWQNASKDLYKSTETVALSSTRRVIEAAQNDDNLCVITDCRWDSRGFNSEHATVFLMDAGTDKILYGISILRYNPNIKRKSTDTAVFDYKGSSKAMEGFGLQIMLEKCKKDKLEIQAFIHDDDGCSRGMFKEFYPNSMEILDIGHAAKNLNIIQETIPHVYILYRLLQDIHH